MGEDTWTVERFQLELLNAEKSGKFTCDDLEPLWDKAKSAISNEEEAVSLYTTFIYLTFRLLKKQGSTDFTKVEELFEEASCFMAECFEQYSDSSIQLEKNYAYFLYTKMGKAEKGREIWARLLEGETGPFAWLEAISLERSYGDGENARRLFYKALDNVNFRPHIIYTAFIQFEREEGDRSDLDNALEKVNLFASKNNIYENKQQQQQKKRKQQFNFDGKGEDNTKKAAAKKLKVDDKNGRNILQEKRSLSQKQSKRKQQKNEENEIKMEIDTNLEEEEKEEENLIKFKTLNVPIGPIIPGINDIKIIEEEEEKEENNNKKEEEQQSSPSFPYSTGLEKNKLFVKHLHFGCKGYELLKFFSKFGKVLDVRIITNWNGRSKGCAYVDFEKDSEASAAVLGSNGAQIRGKEIQVFLSNPSVKERQKPMEKKNFSLPSTSSSENKQQISSSSTKKEEKNSFKNSSSLNFIPRAATQRIGKASRLDLPKNNISKNDEK